MSDRIAAIIFRKSDVSDEALAHGFGIALAGSSAPAPHLLVAELRAPPGYCVAFYRACAAKSSTDLDAIEEFDHACELFEDDAPPAFCVQYAASKSDGLPTIFAVTLDEETLHDDAWRFDETGFVRRFVQADEDSPSGFVVGEETDESAKVTPLVLDDSGAGDEIERAAASYRGTTMLKRDLHPAIVGELLAALYQADTRIAIRIIDPSPESIAAEVVRLNASLRRETGRGGWAIPEVAGIAPPAAFAAFVRTYDWADPRDPSDLFRELAIGSVVGTVHFHRAHDLATYENDSSWKPHASNGLYPIAAISPSALGRSKERVATLALDPTGEQLFVVGARGSRIAGPTFGELLRYFSLGWKTRSPFEEVVIEALMMRAHVRVDPAAV